MVPPESLQTIPTKIVGSSSRPADLMPNTRGKSRPTRMTMRSLIHRTQGDRRNPPPPRGQNGEHDIRHSHPQEGAQNSTHGPHARSPSIAETIRLVSVMEVQPCWSSTQLSLDSTSRESSWMAATVLTCSIGTQSRKWELARQESNPPKLRLKE